jgi:Ca-activated chloride channel family protein
LKTPLDDPRLTSYLLEELSREERRTFEQDLENNPELRTLLEEFRETAATLEQSLQELTTASPCLSHTQKEAVLQATENPRLAKSLLKEKAGDVRRERPFWQCGGLAWSGFGLALLCVGWFAYSISELVVQQAQIPAIPYRAAESKNESSVADFVLEESLPLTTGSGTAKATGAGSVADLSALAPAPPSKPLGLPQAPSFVGGSERGGAAGAVSSQLFGSLVTEQASPVSTPVVKSRSRSLAAVSSGWSGSVNERSKSLSDADLQRGLRNGLEIDRKFIPFPSNESYQGVQDNPFKRVADAESGTSTFSADVDTASYSNVRRLLQDGTLPPPDAVRIEELINYFSYDYPEPEGRVPFSSTVEIASCPWAPEHRLARIGIKAKDVPATERDPLNLVFLIDVSGSMQSENKLPLVRKALRLLVQNLNKTDRVALVVYAGSSGLVLDSTSVSEKRVILNAIDRLEAGGSTNGAAGIELAYKVARDNHLKKGINRVILCTDGDFNVGTTDRDALVRLIEAKRREGVFLNIYGFGIGNIKDATLEQLADKGNGSYGYIDSFAEAQKNFSQQLAGTLVTVAKDVKFQVEFNPAAVAAWRLIGYENRLLAREDFNDDTKDAGEVGAGHTVTVLYEIVPAGTRGPLPGADPHHYFEEPAPAAPPRRATSASKELFFLKMRYKEPDAETSELVTRKVEDSRQLLAKASADFQFAAAVAAYGMQLRNSPYQGAFTWNQILGLAKSGRGGDPLGHRAEFSRLAELARDLQKADDN